VHVLKNGTSLGDEEFDRDARAHDFSFESIEFFAHDTLDLAVGFGANHNYYSDMTGIAVTIRPAAK
jgi:hypothetical protein